jgi:hypothetical protein
MSPAHSAIFLQAGPWTPKGFSSKGGQFSKEATKIFICHVRLSHLRQFFVLLVSGH